MGDVILFGQGQALRDWFGIDGGIDRCSGAYGAGDWAGVAASLATGVAGGVKAAGAKGAGKNFLTGTQPHRRSAIDLEWQLCDDNYACVV